VLIQDVNLVADRDDDILWKFTESRLYTTKSAYNMQFLGMIESNTHNMIWKVWAPPKTIFFAWEAIQNRIWTTSFGKEKMAKLWLMSPLQASYRNGLPPLRQLPLHRPPLGAH
jgi:hypothetical protein